MLDSINEGEEEKLKQRERGRSVLMLALYKELVKDTSG